MYRKEMSKVLIEKENTVRNMSEEIKTEWVLVEVIGKNISNVVHEYLSGQ